MALALALGSAVWVGYQGYSAAQAVYSGMLEGGYPRWLGTTPDGMISKCILKSECLRRVEAGFMNRFDPNVMFVPGVLLLIAGMLRNSGGTSKRVGQPGKGRWATYEDLALYRKPDDEPAGYAGMVINPRSNTLELLALPRYLNASHGATLGGPGAGKSTRYFFPQIALAAERGHSIIVPDLKYPDPKAGFLGSVLCYYELGHAVEVFLPFETGSKRLDILEGVETIDDASVIARLMLPINRRVPGSAYFINIGRRILSSCILAIVEQRQEEPLTSIKEILNILMRGASSLQSFLSNHPSPQVRDNAEAVCELQSAKLTEYIQNLLNVLDIFKNRNLAINTTPKEGHNLNLESVFEKPTLLYIGIPGAELDDDRGNAMLQLIKRLIDRAAARVAARHGGAVPIHTLNLWDEFPSWGEVPNIAKDVATKRSSNLSYQFGFQNLAQGEDRYGAAGFQALLTSNIQQFVFFPRFITLKDAEFVSYHSGEMSELEVSETRSKEQTLLSFGRAGVSERNVASRILSMEEMRTFPVDMALIHLNGVPPARVLMPQLHQSTVRGMVNPLYRFYKHFESRRVQALIPGIFAGLMPRRDPVEEARERIYVDSPSEVFGYFIDRILTRPALTIQYTRGKESEQATLSWRHEELSEEDQVLYTLCVQRFERLHWCKLSVKGDQALMQLNPPAMRGLNQARRYAIRAAPLRDKLGALLQAHPAVQLHDDQLGDFEPLAIVLHGQLHLLRTALERHFGPLEEDAGPTLDLSGSLYLPIPDENAELCRVLGGPDPRRRTEEEGLRPSRPPGRGSGRKRSLDDAGSAD